MEEHHHLALFPPACIKDGIYYMNVTIYSHYEIDYMHY